LKIKAIIWLKQIIEKLDKKHNVSVDEIEDLFELEPKFRKIEKGIRNSEDLYAAFGRTSSGRKVIVFFIYKQDQKALIVSARDMTKREWKLYDKK